VKLGPLQYPAVSIGEELINIHPVRHDRTREHGFTWCGCGPEHRKNSGATLERTTACRWRWD
jgi:hypothetical protein